MKKTIVSMFLSLLYLVLYIVFSLLLELPLGSNYWIGYSLALISTIFVCLSVIYSLNRKSKGFAQSISIVMFSILYAISVLIINVRFAGAITNGKEMKNLYPTKTFIIYHIVCFAIFALLILVLGLNRAKTINGNNSICKEMNTRKDMVTNIKTLIVKVSKLQDSKILVKKLENITEKIESLDINTNYDNDNYNEQICKKIEMLTKEIKNMIDIESIDYTAVDDVISDIEEILIIKNRNKN